MINFESQYFQKISFDKKQLKQFTIAARRDLKIASSSEIPEVIFKFSYDALIKLGIAAIAVRGYKVRSIPGHHMKIIEKLSELFANEDIAVIGNHMRQARNLDFYEGGFEITEKDSGDYLHFVEGVFKKMMQE